MPHFPAPTPAASLRVVLVIPCGSNRSGFIQLGEDVSISRRTSTMVRTLGVASAAAAISLGVAGTAFACNANDFTDSVACNTTNGDATITFTDHNDNTPLTVTVYVGTGHQKQQVGTPLQLNGSAPHTGTVDVPWQTTQPWTAVVTPQHIRSFELKIDAPSGTCSVPTQTPTPTPTPSATQTTEAPTPTVTPTTAAPTETATTAAPTATSTGTVDATATASPTGAVLATTGGGSDAGMIAGIAGAFVVVGAGAVFFLRRRAAGSHS